MLHSIRKLAGFGLVLPLLLAAVPELGAQSSESPLSGFVVAGYGTTNYVAVTASEFRNDFSASISPIIMYSVTSDLLFEAEFEFELEDGGATETRLEYAQIDLLSFEGVQFVAGKFLLPFGLFSERLHPTWINKLPSMPLLYGHGHGGVPEGALLPILSDVGVMARVNRPLGGLWSVGLSAFVTQGPELVLEDDVAGDGHTHDVVPAFSMAEAASAATSAAVPEVPGVAFGTNFSDNNDNKMIGGRLGVVRGGGFEAYVSGFHAMYDANDFLDLYGANLSAEWRSGQLELRGEGAVLWQEFEDAANAAYPTLKSPGYYVQASRRFGAFEPVARWSQLLDAEVDGVTIRNGIRQIAFGLGYWIKPSVPVKAAFEVNLDGDERLLLQWAFGF